MAPELQEIIDLAKQLFPREFHYLKSGWELLPFMAMYCAERDIFPHCPGCSTVSLSRLTLEDCKVSADQGFDVVINDGKILGFKKAS